MVVTGAAGALGRRVVARLVADAAVGRVVAIDADVPATSGPGPEWVAADLATGDVKPLLEGAGTVVHLAFSPTEASDPGAGLTGVNLEGTRRLLEAASAVGVRHLVAMSSATVYGAWPTNPVPLTEEAAVRPNPGFGYGWQKAEVERLCREWALAHPGSTAAVLRPAPALGAEEGDWLARALQAASPIRTADADPVRQFVHLDDLAAAVALAVTGRLDGTYNVAADGWVSGEAVRALAGAPPRLPVPERVVSRVAAVTWRWRVGRLPPGLLPYTQHPWVVANDRLRAAGWDPASTNEEVFVAAHKGTPWSRLSPKRRQELALAAAAGLVVTAGVGAALLARWLRRRLRARADGR